MKLKANELRVGNIIYDKWNKIERRVNPVDIMNQANGDLYSAVEITGKRLTDFGFKKDIAFFYTKGDFTVRVLDGDNIRILIYWKDSLISTRNTKVHQLQNLYFALTGKELELNG